MVVEALLPKLSDPAQAVRRATATALGEIGDIRAIPPLITALSRDDAHPVLSACADALGSLRATAATPALIATLGNLNAGARAHAAAALHLITGQEFGDDQGRWQAWWTAHEKP